MVLYDFLYLDKDRIDAFYAQMFEGLLKQVEQTTGTEEQEAEKVEGGIKPLMSGTLSGYKSIQEITKEQIDPKQLVVIDTLTVLSKNSCDIENACQGDIVKAQGNLHIATNNVLRLFADIGDMFLLEQVKTSKEKKELKQIKKLIKSFLDHISIDSILLLKTETHSIVGSLKREFLTEDPDTFQLKHGASGLDDIHIIGFYENKHRGEGEEDYPVEDFISSSRQFSEGIKNLFFPPHSIIITPIAIYKEIHIEP